VRFRRAGHGKRASRSAIVNQKVGFAGHLQQSRTSATGQSFQFPVVACSFSRRPVFGRKPSFKAKLGNDRPRSRHSVSWARPLGAPTDSHERASGAGSRGERAEWPGVGPVSHEAAGRLAQLYKSSVTAYPLSIHRQDLHVRAGAVHRQSDPQGAGTKHRGLGVAALRAGRRQPRAKCRLMPSAPLLNPGHDVAEIAVHLAIGRHRRTH